MVNPTRMFGTAVQDQHTHCSTNTLSAAPTHSRYSNVRSGVGGCTVVLVTCAGICPERVPVTWCGWGVTTLTAHAEPTPQKK